MDEQQEQTPHKEEYTPRPKSQVWLARIGLVAFLLVSYRLTKGVRELEGIYHYQMNGRPLMTAWIVVAVWAVLNELALWTGGGALIRFLTGEELPVVKALRHAAQAFPVS